MPPKEPSSGKWESRACPGATDALSLILFCSFSRFLNTLLQRNLQEKISRVCFSEVTWKPRIIGLLLWLQSPKLRVVFSAPPGVPYPADPYATTTAHLLWTRVKDGQTHWPAKARIQPVSPQAVTLAFSSDYITPAFFLSIGRCLELPPVWLCCRICFKLYGKIILPFTSAGRVLCSPYT